MSDIIEMDAQGTGQLLTARAEQLDSQGSRFELVVIGGAALLALGLVDRTTRDVDVVALADDRRLESAKPFPPQLDEARRRVARDFRIPESWLNGEPTSLLDHGLPDGFLERVATRPYGPGLSGRVVANTRSVAGLQSRTSGPASRAWGRG